jgi:drug/metabolite transporter (DMT)-like permease
LDSVEQSARVGYEYNEARARGGAARSRSTGCLFGGGTVIALSWGELRESVDIGFLVSHTPGYRAVRQLLSGPEGFAALARPGAVLRQTREIRTNQYGIRTMLDSPGVGIMVEIVLEARMTLQPPAADDQVCGIASLTPLDLAASKLLANVDRWAEDGVFSRDLIDLAMMQPRKDLLLQAAAKAQEAYGIAVERSLHKAVDYLQRRQGRLSQCLRAMQVDVPAALVLQRIKTLAKMLPACPARRAGQGSRGATAHIVNQQAHSEATAHSAPDNRLMLPLWAWIPITVGAALAQTARNTAQRSLSAQAGTMGATLVRFLYGLPFAALWLLILYHWPSSSATVPARFDTTYFAWILMGGLSQIAATAFLLAAMKERNFVVAVTYSKTEVMQVVLFSSLFLHEFPGPMVLAAIVLATIGVVLVSMPRGQEGQAGQAGVAGGQLEWGGKTLGFGLASGACFALSAVGYRGGSLWLGSEVPPWLAGAWGVLWAQTMQTVLLGGWILLRTPDVIARVLAAWRISLWAGSMGAIASICWFTAFAMTTAAQVRTLGMVEVLFSYLVSRRLLREKLALTEQIGLALVGAGLLLVCTQL